MPGASEPALVRWLNCKNVGFASAFVAASRPLSVFDGTLT